MESVVKENSNSFTVLQKQQQISSWEEKKNWKCLNRKLIENDFSTCHFIRYRILEFFRYVSKVPEESQTYRSTFVLFSFKLIYHSNYWFEICVHDGWMEYRERKKADNLPPYTLFESRNIHHIVPISYSFDCYRYNCALKQGLFLISSTDCIHIAPINLNFRCKLLHFCSQIFEGN